MWLCSSCQWDTHSTGLKASQMAKGYCKEERRTLHCPHDFYLFHFIFFLTSLKVYLLVWGFGIHVNKEILCTASVERTFYFPSLWNLFL